MDANVFHALNTLTTAEIIDELGWETFLRYKVETWRRTPDWFRAACGLVAFLGMSEDEYADWAIDGTIAARVRQVWTATSKEAPRVQDAPVLKDDWRVGEAGQGTQRAGGTW